MGRIEKTKISLREFLIGIRDDLLPLFQEHKLSFEILNNDEITVLTDIEKLERIIRNLLSNALKFSEKGGVSIRYGTDNKRFFIEIHDTGRGIPAEKIPMIFHRFYKVEQKDTQGLGLGLSIVQQLVDAMKGEVKVRSRVNEGTSITVFLPNK